MANILGVAKGLYDYASQQPNQAEDDHELSIEENEMLYILERGDDGWWKVKKKAEGDQEEGDEGLVPANYVEEANPIARATAMYDYDRQTSEEVSFAEGATVDIYDKEDPDWFLVGSGGSYGFAPSNYLEESGAHVQSPATVAIQGPSGAIQTGSVSSLPPPAPPLPIPGNVPHVASPSTVFATQPRQAQPDYTDHTAIESDQEPEESAPPTPQRPIISNRPMSQDAAPPKAPRPSDRQAPPLNDYYSPNEVETKELPSQNQQSVKPYATWPVQEVDGKKKKRKGTLGIGNNEISWAPSKASESIQTWPITSLVTYSTEKKHVFIDLQSPPKAASFDFHAGSSNAAQEINNMLGDLAGAARAPGIREVAGALNAPLPALPQNSGLARRERENGFPRKELSDNDDDHLPQSAGAELLNGTEKYATVLYDFEAQGDDEVTVRAGARVIVLDDRTSAEWWQIRSGRKKGVVPAEYLEVSAPRKASKKNAEHRERKSGEQTRERSASRSRAQELKPQSTGGKSKPDANKIRSWTDRSKSFKVDAQLLGCSDGKIHLHKSNGVKISVPITKMSMEDIEYVEHKTGRTLQEPPPPADATVIAQKARADKEARRREAAKAAEGSKTSSSFDWFDFFLSCGCDPNSCQRYTSSFERDGLAEEDISSLEPTLLRNLGLKEGDIFKVGRQVDVRLNRKSALPPSFSDAPHHDDAREGSGLLTGPNGELKNNTRRGRPERTGTPNDTVDPAMLNASGKDDPWTPARTEEQPPPKPIRPQSTGAAPNKNLEDLSLLDQPLIPVPAAQQPVAAIQPPTAQQYSSPAANAQNVPAQQYPSQQFLQSIQQMQPQKTASIPAVQPFMPQTSFGSAIVAHKTGGGDMSTFVQPPLYPHQTGYQQQQMAMMQNMPAAQYQDPFKTGSAAPYLDPFKTGGYMPMQATGYQQPQATGFVPQQTGFPQQQPMGFMPPQTSFQSQSPYTMPMYQTGFAPQQTGFVSQQPVFATQPTGYSQPLGSMQMQQQTGFNPAQPFGNSALPAFGGQLNTQQTGYPSFQAPQQTGYGFQQPQPTGFGGYSGFAAMPQQQQQQQPQVQMSAGMLKMQQMMAEAEAQKSQGQQSFAGQQGSNAGGFQPVQFGRSSSAGPNNRRANLNNASADNPFGF